VEADPRPTIKSYGQLTAADLEAFPIWVNCRTADEGRPWYDEAFEDDYRPHSGDSPTPPYHELYVVQANATLSDGSMLPALVDLLPAMQGSGIDEANASVFASNGERVSLLSASIGLAETVRRANLDALDRLEESVFPVTVLATIPGAPVITVLDWFTQRLTWPG